MARLTADHEQVLRAALDEHDLKCMADDIVRAARSAISMVTDEPLQEPPVGSSRLGGLPDLPEDTAWPQVDGRHLVFIAQFDLADLQLLDTSPLPAAGMLYFFYGVVNEEEVGHVLLRPSPVGELIRHDLPPTDTIAYDRDEDVDEKPMYPAVSMEMEPNVSLPQYISDGYNLLADAARSNCEYEDEDEFEEQYFEAEQELWPFDEIINEITTLFGHERAYDGSGGYDAEHARHDIDIENIAEAAAAQWQLLFEVGSHNATDMMWLNEGWLQFFIHEKDLAALNFGNVFLRRCSF